MTDVTRREFANMAKGFPALPIFETGYVDSIEVGVLDAGAISSGKIRGSDITIADGGTVKSEGYDPGVAGWQIGADGSAEFNNVTVRGVIEAGVGSDVDWSYISNVTIDNADITNLSFSKITAGTNGATLTLGSGGVLRTAASGERVELSNSGLSDIRWYDSGGSLQGTMGSGTGSQLELATSANQSIYLNSGEDIILRAIGAGQTIDLQGDVFLTSGDFDFGANDLLNTGLIRSGNNGAVSSVAFGWSADPNTGIFRAGSDDMRLVAGGTSVAQVVSTRFGPGSDNSKTLGGAGLRWQEIYMVGGIGSVNNVSRDANGRLTVATSSRRYKHNIHDYEDGMNVIEMLRPVGFRWNDDPRISVPHEDRGDVGLIAEEVRDVPGAERFVLLDDDGIPVSVRYELLVVPLIKAVQQLESRVRELEATHGN